MDYKGNDIFARFVITLLNTMCTDSGGKTVVENLVNSKKNYTYTSTLQSNEKIGGSFDDETQLLEFNSINTFSFAEETFHAYQYENGEIGKTANREVEAKLFSSLMNLNIDGWNQDQFFIPITGLADSKYSLSMEYLLYKGFDYHHYQTAINSFFTEALTGPDYKSLGYKIGPINSNPIIQRFLPRKK